MLLPLLLLLIAIAVAVAAVGVAVAVFAAVELWATNQKAAVTAAIAIDREGNHEPKPMRQSDTTP